MELLEYYEDGALELYNLAGRPERTKNLAGAKPETATSLRERLHVWLDEVKAQLPSPAPGAR
ncbi:MAG: hypothetical protein R2724_08480 [Bryobacterales bacterium]